jgi:hypothetical protein
MRKIIHLVSAIIVCLVILESVSAANIIGVSPGNIDFKNVLRGGYAESYITITLSSEEPVLIEFEPRGDIKDWLEYTPQNITVMKSKPGKIVLSIKPPTDIPNGNYTGFFRVLTSALGTAGSEGHATGVIRAVIDVAISVEVTDIEVLKCGAGGFSVQSVEKGDDIKFNLIVSNNGNIRLKPKVLVDIWDQDQISVVKSEQFTGEEILPTKDGTSILKVSSKDLEIGQYWADVSVPDCYAKETLTFDVLEPGALTANGILFGINAPFISETGDTIPITAAFKNIGEKEVGAKFEGKITQDGKIIQLLKSDVTNVPISQATNFTFFFTPKKSGKYLASGRVFYDKKRTFESSAVMNVLSKKIGTKEIVLALVYISLIILIALLYFKIRREKRRYKEKLKNIR